MKSQKSILTNLGQQVVPGLWPSSCLQNFNVKVGAKTRWFTLKEDAIDPLDIRGLNFQSFFGARILSIGLPIRCLSCIQPMGVVSLSWLSSRRLSRVLRDVCMISSLTTHEVHGDSHACVWNICSTVGHKADTLNTPCPVKNYTMHSSSSDFFPTIVTQITFPYSYPR